MVVAFPQVNKVVGDSASIVTIIFTLLEPVNIIPWAETPVKGPVNGVRMKEELVEFEVDPLVTKDDGRSVLRKRLCCLEFPSDTKRRANARRFNADFI